VVAVVVARTTSPKIQTPAVVLNNEVVSVAMALRMMPMLQMVPVPVPVLVLRVLQMLLIWWVVQVLLQWQVAGAEATWVVVLQEVSAAAATLFVRVRLRRVGGARSHFLRASLFLPMSRVVKTLCVRNP